MSERLILRKCNRSAIHYIIQCTKTRKTSLKQFLLSRILLHTVLRPPMSFFDTTPQGRILNRFGKDVDVLDASMPFILRFWIICTLECACTFLVISWTTPYFILPFAVVMLGYFVVQRIYVATSRQLKRLESVSR